MSQIDMHSLLVPVCSSTSTRHQELGQQAQEQKETRAGVYLCGACCALLSTVRCKSEHPDGKCPAEMKLYKEWELGMCKQHAFPPKKVDVATIIGWKRSEGAALVFSKEGQQVWDLRPR